MTDRQIVEKLLRQYTNRQTPIRQRDSRQVKNNRDITINKQSDSIQTFDSLIGRHRTQTSASQKKDVKQTQYRVNRHTNRQLMNRQRLQTDNKQQTDENVDRQTHSKQLTGRQETSR